MMDDSVQQVLRRLVKDDEEVATQLVEQYYARLLQVARRKMHSIPMQVADEEGAVVSALRSFFSGVKKEQFADVNSSVELWRLLATITARKAIQQVRRHWRGKGEQAKVDRLADVSRALDNEPNPAQVAAFVDECEVRIRELEDETLQQIALLRLEGNETSDIAKKLGVHQRTIQRKLALIQSRWCENE